MKKPLIELLILVYCVPISVIIVFYLITRENSSNNLMIGVFAIPFILMFVNCILVLINIINALRLQNTDQYIHYKTIMLFKLLLIPFYIVNFACWFVASSVFHIALIVWPFIPFIIAYTYITILGTSAYNIAKLLYLKKNNTITSKQFLIHSLLQLTFVLDIFDTIYLTVKRKHFI